MVEVLIPNTVMNRLNSDNGLTDDDSFILSSAPLESFNITDHRAAADHHYRDTSINREVVDHSAVMYEKVQSQVEWYFSDENLRKDAFLMKHIARNKRGFVSLKLVASLRKVKSLTKDCKLVAESIRGSKVLELNEDGTKVRRLEPIPDVDYSPIPKTIIITDYPSANPEVSHIHEEYSRYGVVSRVTILSPGKAIPLYIKSCKSKFPSIGKEVCVLVEYKTAEMAKRACKESKQNWRQTANVQLLAANGTPTQQQQPNEESTQSKSSTTPLSSEKKSSRGRKGSPSETSRNKFSNGNRLVVNHRPLKSVEYKSPKNGYGSDSGYSGVSRSPSTSPKSSPPPTRRFFNELSVVKSPSLVTVIRMPTGPDGTKGFHAKR